MVTMQRRRPGAADQTAPLARRDRQVPARTGRLQLPHERHHGRDRLLAAGPARGRDGAAGNAQKRFDAIIGQIPGLTAPRPRRTRPPCTTCTSSDGPQAVPLHARRVLQAAGRGCADRSALPALAHAASRRSPVRRRARQAGPPSDRRRSEAPRSSPFHAPQPATGTTSGSSAKR